MVEMLGVLAVMGVLSVGGVAMYTNAMNKYRANELLNESSKRAVVIATQILSGKSVSSDMINQFDNNGTTFTGVEEVGTNQFKLTLSGVDDDVCTQLKATIGSNTIIQEVGDKCAYLTFNNDLSKGTSSSNTGGSNGGSGQQEPEPEPIVDPCNGHGTYNGTTCTCTDNYYGDTCENAPLTCEHGYWDTTYHICFCEGSGYDGDRCQNEVAPPTHQEVYSLGACSAGLYHKYYCVDTNTGVPGGVGCEQWTCEAGEGDYPYFPYNWVWDTTLMGTCEDAGDCDWIEE